MVQVETRVERAWFQRLILKYDKLLFSFASNFNSRPCSRASRAFHGWGDWLAARQAVVASLRRVTLRWARLQLAEPFGVWVEQVEELRQHYMLIRMMKQRVSRAAAAGAFGIWRHHIAAVNARRAAFVRAERFVVRMRHRLLHAALSAWAHAAGESRNLRGRLIKLVQRWGQIRESTAFERWVDWVEELELMRGKDGRALQQLARVHIARALRYSPSRIARLVIQRI